MPLLFCGASLLCLPPLEMLWFSISLSLSLVILIVVALFCLMLLFCLYYFSVVIIVVVFYLFFQLVDANVDAKGQGHSAQ